MHDYLTQRGGAERVVLSMLAAFPGAPLYTALYEPDSTFPEFADHDVRPMWTNRFASLRRDHRRGIFIYPFAFSSLKVDADVVLCSSSGFAHGARTDGRKVVYCYTPARWLYDQAPEYLASWPAPVRLMANVTGPVLRAWDRKVAATAHAYLTSSSVVRQRIRDTYDRDAEVIPPAVSIDVNQVQATVDGVNPGFILCVSRLLPYKHIEAVVEAFDLLPDARLVVVGEGPGRQGIETLAGNNVTLLGRATAAELAWLYTNCVGLVAASYEDFGLTPIEAAAYGKPSAVLRFGGFLDTVVDGETGVFFDSAGSALIASVIRALVQREWSTAALLSHASEYSQTTFSAHIGRTCRGPLLYGDPTSRGLAGDPPVVPGEMPLSAPTCR